VRWFHISPLTPGKELKQVLLKILGVCRVQFTDEALEDQFHAEDVFIVLSLDIPPIVRSEDINQPRLAGCIGVAP
jgi:hypothetical protein